MSLKVVEDYNISWYNHSTDKTEKSPVLNVDAAVGIWLVSGLLDQLKIELVTKRFFL